MGLDKKGNERRDILKKYFESWLKISLGDQSKAIAATYIVQSLDQFSNGEKIDSILSLFKGLCISPIYISKRIIEKLSSLIIPLHISSTLSYNSIDCSNFGNLCIIFWVSVRYILLVVVYLHVSSK